MHSGRTVSLIAAVIVLGACKPAPTPDAADPPASVEAARDTQRPGRDSLATAPDSPPVDRNPKTDPWLFEGIPNFEDLASGRSGDWLVVLASAERSGAAPRPTIMASADSALAQAQQRAWNAGLVPFVVASEKLPAFESGLTVVVLGPFAKDVAERQLNALQRSVPGAYLKVGW